MAFKTLLLLVVLWSHVFTRALSKNIASSTEGVNSSASEPASDPVLITEILEFVTEGNTSHSKREFTKTPNALSFTWNQTTQDEQTRAYNLSIILSGCSRVKRDTQIGTYLFVNGSSKENATFFDILHDLTTTKRNAPDLHVAKKILLNHTLIMLQTVFQSMNSLLRQQLLCQNNTNSSFSPIIDVASSRDTESPEALIHSELRRLLWLPDRETLLKASVILGQSSFFGGVAAFATWRVEQETEHPFLHLIRRPRDNSSIPTHLKPIIAGSAVFFTSMLWDLMSRAPFVDPEDYQYAQHMMGLLVISTFYSFGALFVLPIILAKLAKWVKIMSFLPTPNIIMKLGVLDPSPSYFFPQSSLDASNEDDQGTCVAPDLAIQLAFGSDPQSFQVADAAGETGSGFCDSPLSASSYEDQKGD